MEREFALARAELDLDRTQRQPERNHLAANGFEHRLHQVEARLGEIGIAGRDEADLRRLGWPGRGLGLDPRVVELEDMEFDLKPRHVVVAGVGERPQRLAVEVARRERHRLAVAEIDVAQHPAGLRRPRQHAERRRIGDHQEVGAALHLAHAEAAARGEYREGGLLGGILGEQRRRHRDTVAHRARGVSRHQRLAAQDAVLVGKRQPHHFEPVLFDQPLGPRRRLELLVVPQAVALDEGSGGALLR